MRVLVVGSGGREHALVWKINQSPLVSEIFCAPGNPGIQNLAQCLPVKANDIDGLAHIAGDFHIDLTVVGPENPLADGIVDEFRRRGLTIFGPTRRAAELEWSKVFAKQFMGRHSIPTAAFRVFGIHEFAEAAEYANSCPLPAVVKADGLAAGKGVLVCRTRDEVHEAVAVMMQHRSFGVAGDQVVVEECMEGEEASVFAVTDGREYVILAPAQDHKRVFDGDRGKNTGGMGAFAPTRAVTPEILDIVQRRIIEPTIRGMAEEARLYYGCLYVGLMLTNEGPKVVEYNSRFGDPETQVVLPLFQGDLAELLLASANGTIDGYRHKYAGQELNKGSAVCVVLASGGYPDSYETGKKISGLDAVAGMSDAIVFHAGTKLEGDTVATAGGRVLGVTAYNRNDNLAEACETAYNAVGKISFDGMHYRRDIAAKTSGGVMTRA